MEQSREQQHQITSSAAPQPIYPAQPNAYYTPTPVKASRWLRFRRLLRLLLRRVLYGTTIVGRVLRPFAAFIAIVLVLLGALSYLSYLLWWPSSDTAVVDTRVAAIAPAPAVERYIQGQQSFNADLMWEAFSTDFQARQLSQGASKDTLQSQADQERQMGFQYSHYDYIGGVKREDGGSMYFYSVDVKLPDQQVKVPYVYIADADGKIINIMYPRFQ
jgi:hypothetical protein